MRFFGNGSYGHVHDGTGTTCVRTVVCADVGNGAGHLEVAVSDVELLEVCQAGHQLPDQPDALVGAQPLKGTRPEVITAM